MHQVRGGVIAARGIALLDIDLSIYKQKVMQAGDELTLFNSTFMSDDSL